MQLKPTTSSQLHIRSLTSLRFFAAIAVVFFHFLPRELLNTGAFSTFVIHGNKAVSFFYALSGFVMALWASRYSSFGKLEFYQGRFARIYPVYFCSAIFALTASWVVGSFKGIPFFHLSLYWLGIQAWFPSLGGVINSPAWSISVELFFYLSFPLVFKLVQHPKQKFYAALSYVAFIFCLQVYAQKFAAPDFFKWAFYFPLFHWPTFIIGIVVGDLFVHGQLDRFLKYPGLVTTVALGLLYWLLSSPLFLPYGFIMHNGVLAPVFLLLILGACRKSIWDRLFGLRIFVYLGEVSFGIYLLHHPIYALVRHQFYYKLDRQSFFLVYLLVVVLISILSYEALESPARNYLRKKRNV